MYFVYVIKSAVDGRLYKGLTCDLQKRINEHNRGKTKTTKAFKPWELVYYEKFSTREEARQREKYLKTGNGRRFLKSLNL
jgi:putative endonuclease